MFKCKTADKYQGLRDPKCNKGRPCVVCIRKRQLQQVMELLDLPKLDLGNEEYTELVKLDTAIAKVVMKVILNWEDK